MFLYLNFQFLKKTKKCCKTVKVFQPRCRLLTAYFCAINGNIKGVQSEVKRGVEKCLKHDNMFEETRLMHNQEKWMKGGQCTRDNTDWQRCVMKENCDSDDFEEVVQGLVMYTLPLPTELLRKK